MIFYFSGTGNTEWAAKELAKKTKEKLLFIPEELHSKCEYELEANERIGFCFPVHGWQPPHIVKEFIEKLSVKTPHSTLGSHYCYALVTCGDSAGRTIEMFNKELSRKGMNIDSALSLTMPESYVCFPFMYTDTPEREREKITQATRDLKTAVDIIINKKKGIFRIKKGVTPWTFSHVIGAYFNARMITDKKFSVDKNLCIHCGKCEKTCPTGDIRLINGLPQWNHDGSCTNCLACYHHCPKHAINYGNITRSRGQYYFGHNTVISDEQV